MKGISRFLELQDEISEFIGKAVCWMCLAMIGVLLFEIAARYLFLSPTAWAHESTTMLYGTFCMLAGVYTHKHHGHVRSEVVYHLFSPRGRAILDVITGTIVFIMFAVFFTASCEFAYESWQLGERSSKSTWAPPIYPFKTMLPLGVGLVMLQGLVHLIRDIRVAFNLSEHNSPAS